MLIYILYHLKYIAIAGLKHICSIKIPSKILDNDIIIFTTSILNTPNFIPSFIILLFKSNTLLNTYIYAGIYIIFGSIQTSNEKSNPFPTPSIFIPREITKPIFAPFRNEVIFTRIFGINVKENI